MRDQHISIASFAPVAELPYGLNITHFAVALERVLETVDALAVAGSQRGLPALERWAGRSTVSALVSASMVYALAGVAPDALAVNGLPDGYPDLLLAGHHRGDCAHCADTGLEIKASTRGLVIDVHQPKAGFYCVVGLDPTGAALITDVWVARLTPRDFSVRLRSDGSSQIRIGASGRRKLTAGRIYHLEELPEEVRAA